MWTNSELLVDLLIELGWLLGDTLLSASKGLRGNLQATVHEPHAGRHRPEESTMTLSNVGSS